MTVRERVLASRLIQKIDGQNGYAKQIGLSYEIATAEVNRGSGKTIQKKEKKN